MALYAFDGTDDNDSTGGTTPTALLGDTNVYRFYNAYEGAAGPKGADYVPGVGTKFGVVGQAVGGAFGLGWDPRVAETYDALCANYAAGDHVIDVVGFSRGAAMTLDFVNKVNTNGIQIDGKTLATAPAIRFVGVFDVVDAFGVANLGGPISSYDPVHTLSLPSNVQHCFHAMALDERRPSFVNHRVAGAYEVWFRGVHSDIGGGNNNPGLEYVALRWMYRKAMACGLPIPSNSIVDSAVHPEAKIKPNLFSEVSLLFWRTVNPTDLVHYAVSQHPILPGEDCHPLSGLNPIESVADEQTRLTAPALT